MIDALDEAAAAVRAGEVVVIPTDTVYGLACDPSSAVAVERIYVIKERPAGLELTLLAASLADVEAAVELDDTARRLAARFWPGPLSIVAPVGRRRLAIPRGGSTLSTRVPNHTVLLDLLSRTGPLATTSANRHGAPAAIDADGARAALGGAVVIVLDGGPAAGLASTIIDCSRTPPEVLREGPISTADLVPSAPIQTTMRYDAG
ncbi:MAG: threonylcarbamoyl-AMP synthase [Candidatus Dormibacteraeota bacterium]|nr:threonylcarbamoyl-AMP synthase [Candidatus Dormibacteraeota bacterium]